VDASSQSFGLSSNYGIAEIQTGTEKANSFYREAILHYHHRIGKSLQLFGGLGYSYFIHDSYDNLLGNLHNRNYLLNLPIGVQVSTSVSEKSSFYIESGFNTSYYLKSNIDVTSNPENYTIKPDAGGFNFGGFIRLGFLTQLNKQYMAGLQFCAHGDLWHSYKTNTNVFKVKDAQSFGFRLIRRL
jgi:hypothetical protein